MLGLIDALSNLEAVPLVLLLESQIFSTLDIRVIDLDCHPVPARCIIPSAPLDSSPFGFLTLTDPNLGSHTALVI